jgi:hypothetical protein
MLSNTRSAIIQPTILRPYFSEIPHTSSTSSIECQMPKPSALQDSTVDIHISRMRNYYCLCRNNHTLTESFVEHYLTSQTLIYCTRDQSGLYHSTALYRACPPSRSAI